MPLKVFLIFIALLLLVGCSPPGSVVHDGSIGKTEEDFNRLSTMPFNHEPIRPLFPRERKLEPELPPAFAKKVSLNVEASMHVADVLSILCEKAEIPYLFAPDLEGSLAYHAVKRPFHLVLEDICTMLELTFLWDQGVLVVKRDLPVYKTYPLWFLAQSRKSETHVSNRTDIMSRGGEESSGQNRSGYTLETKSQQDFWKELEDALGMFLKPPSTFSLQKHAGLLHVHAPYHMQKQVADLLRRVERHVSGQVLIEAKIVEVTLKDAYRGGIDWAQFKHKALNASASLGNVFRTPPALMGHMGREGSMTLNLEEKHMQTLLHFMESFGTVRTLSSPRITVLHNQNAFLKVAENQIFFDVKYERQFLSGGQKNYGSLVASHSRIQSIPIGLVLSVHPAINQDTGAIILNLRPTISRIVGTREDPSVKLMAESLRRGSSDVGSEIPIVAVREMDSVLKLQSGQTAILGGLMIEGADHLSSGLPGTRRGAASFLTSAKRSNRMVTELVIFLKATIVGTGSVTVADRRLYEGFTQDPRPLEQQEEKA